MIDILDGGKILKLRLKHIRRRYGKLEIDEYETLVPWYEIAIYYSKKKLKSLPNFRNEDLWTKQIHFYNSILHELITKNYRDGGYEMDADYQRGHVWTSKDKIALIDSIFQGIPIGKIVLIELPYKENSPAFEVLDGKQRITAIIKFYEGRFKYKGRYYRELSILDRSYFTNFNISIGYITGKFSQEDRYKYFLRLNTFGKPQDQNHINKVIKLLEKEVKKD